MRLFLDSSVLLAASGSARSASRLLIEIADCKSWKLTNSRYFLEETRKNVGKLGHDTKQCFESELIDCIQFEETIYIVDRAMVYTVAKDRPVITTAKPESCDALLTLDRADF